MKASRISGQRPSWGRRVAAMGMVIAAAVLVLGLGARLSLKAGKGAAQLARTSPKPAAVLAQMPLSFEPNHGQTDPQVKFLARGAGYGLFLTSDEAVLKLQHSSRAAQAVEVVRMKLAGANPTARLEGGDPLPGKSNYLIGNDPSKWHSHIPHYERVGYQQVYPGIDLVYYGNRGRLEYDFQVAPGASPSAIQLTFAGQEKLNLDANGDLILRTTTGDLRFNAPVAYQEANGERRSVNSRFVLAADNRVGFTVGDYDRNRALIIDPVLTYSSYLGGNGDESCAVITGTPVPGCPAIAVDSALNYYVAGSTTSTNFPTVTTSTSAPPFQTGLAAGAHANVFVAKFDINNTLQEATYIGGDGTDVTAGLAVDAASNVYVAGTTTSTNFPTHNGFNPGPTTGGTHVFLTVLAPDFTTPSYSTYIAGTGTDTASGLAIDGKGNAFISGITSSTDFPTTPTALQPASLSATDSQFFMTKVNTLATASNSLLYSTYFGGGNPASGAIVKGGGIAVDSSGNAYITGGTNFLHVGNTLTDFPILNASQDCLGTPAVVPAPTTPPTCSPSVTLPDAFVAKINPNAVGSAGLLYSTYLGGAGTDIGYAIALDSGLNVYVTGSSDSPAQYIPSGSTPLQSAPGGGLDAFVAKLNNPAATALVTPTYFTFLGGASTDVGMAISADTSGNARVTGWTAGGFPVHNPGPFPVGPGSGTHAFVARIDTTGSSTATALDFSSPFGGSGVDHGTGIAVDPNFTTYVAGDTSGGIPTAGSP